MYLMHQSVFVSKTEERWPGWNACSWNNPLEKCDEEEFSETADVFTMWFKVHVEVEYSLFPTPVQPPPPSPWWVFNQTLHLSSLKWGAQIKISVFKRFIQLVLVTMVTYTRQRSASVITSQIQSEHLRVTLETNIKLLLINHWMKHKCNYSTAIWKVTHWFLCAKCNQNTIFIHYFHIWIFKK